MDRNKILVLTYPETVGAVADIVKQYFKERRNLNTVDLNDPSTQPENLNHIIGAEWQTDTTQTAFLDVISNDYYFMRYHFYSVNVVTVAEMITHIQTEDMTVLRLTRSEEDFIISYMNATHNLWGVGGDLYRSPTQQQLDDMNTAAATMVITDDDMRMLADIWFVSNEMFDEFDTAGVINFVEDYDNIPFDNPRGVLSRFFPDPNITSVDSGAIRPTDFLTQATKDTIVSNNDLTNRIATFFVQD